MVTHRRDSVQTPGKRTRARAAAGQAHAAGQDRTRSAWGIRRDRYTRQAIIRQVQTAHGKRRVRMVHPARSNSCAHLAATL
ncbi:hypothetical protein IA54_010450 [Xanthomonas phaseoli pv. syngonii LMG 9055]|uniref:Uncharacterized protein n=1 Tax=Xanthomonas phaseoli pv. syngonii LMG 9055 TaxID=1437878 RepID=A0A1V9GYL5_9XANT|nr:hypothetical protein IA54_010450 [Xanthomonas phaseoli pv. syngonii LMG 9055]